jgi:hypothetical protein
MDPVKKIEALESKITGYEAEVTTLKAQLATAPTPEKERIIAQQLDRVYEQMKADKDQLIVLYPQVPVLDSRPIMTRAWAPIHNDPLLTGGGVLFATTTAMWMMARYYAMARHHFAPYTESQLIWRRWIFFINAKSVPNAKRIAGFSAFIVLLRTWTNKPPPSKWE